LLAYFLIPDLFVPCWMGQLFKSHFIPFYVVLNASMRRASLHFLPSNTRTDILLKRSVF